MPAAPHAGVLPGKFFHASASKLSCLFQQNTHVRAAYTAAMNLLDYSVVVVPVTKANATIDKAEPNYVPLNETDQKNWNTCIITTPFDLSLLTCNLDDPDIFDGAPVGVQIVARKFEEEKIWAIGKLIYQLLLAERNQ